MAKKINKKINPLGELFDIIDKHLRYVPGRGKIFFDEKRLVLYNKVEKYIRDISKIILDKNAGGTSMLLLQDYDNRLLLEFKSYLSMYIINAIDKFFDDNVILFSEISEIFYKIINRSLFRNITRNREKNKNVTIDVNLFKTMVSKDYLYDEVLYSCVAGVKSATLAYIRSYRNAEKKEMINIKKHYFIIRTMDELFIQMKDIIKLCKIRKEEHHENNIN